MSLKSSMHYKYNISQFGLASPHVTNGYITDRETLFNNPVKAILLPENSAEGLTAITSLCFSFLPSWVFVSLLKKKNRKQVRGPEDSIVAPSFLNRYITLCSFPSL